MGRTKRGIKKRGRQLEQRWGEGSWEENSKRSTLIRRPVPRVRRGSGGRRGVEEKRRKKGCEVEEEGVASGIERGSGGGKRP